MNYNNDFKYDLQVGQVKEKELGVIFQDAKIEVKYDLQALTTGNVFVEYESRNKPSGISISQSEFYAFILSNETILLIETKSLKKLCRKYFGTNRDIKGGDNNTSKGIILPLKDII